MGLVLQETSIQVKYWNHASLTKKQVKEVLFIKARQNPFYRDLMLKLDISSIQVISIENYEIRFFKSDYTHIPMYLCRVSFLSLFTCFFMYAIFISVSHMMHWWVLFKCFRKTGCESLPCDELSSCKVFQEFVVGLDLFCNPTSGYEFSDLRLLS